MNHQLKSYLKTGVLFFGIVLFFMNCQQGSISDIETNENSSKTKFIVETMTYEEFKQVSGLHKISQKIDRKKSAGVNSKDYTNGSFTILTDVVKKVTLGNVESYTFLIETPTNEVYFLENFCVEKTSDSIINYFMYHYRWLDTNENGLNFAVEISRVDEGLIDVDLLSSFTKTITTDECIEVVYSSCSSDGNADGHGPTDQGDGTSYCSGSDPIGINVGSCDFGGAGGSNTGDNDNSGTTTTDTDTSTSNTGGGSDNGTETDPNGTAIVCTDNCPKSNSIQIDILTNALDLNSQQIAWLENHTAITNQLVNYLNDNTNPDGTFIQEAIDFVKLAVEILIENEELDFEDLRIMMHEMDKKCQANIVSSALFVNSNFTNIFFNALIKPTNKHIAFRDKPNSSNEDDVPIGAVANTQPFRGFDSRVGDFVIIDFSNDYLDQATDLSIVVTLYHEMLHAYIIHLYHEGKLLEVFPQYSELNSALANYYANPTPTNLTLAVVEEHNRYVDFIDLLATSVHQYSLDNNINGVNLEYAKKLVWGSLIGTAVFTSNLTPLEQAESQTLINYEIENNTNAKGPKNCN